MAFNFCREEQEYAKQEEKNTSSPSDYNIQDLRKNELYVLSKDYQTHDCVSTVKSVPYNSNISKNGRMALIETASLSEEIKMNPSSHQKIRKQTYLIML